MPRVEIRFDGVSRGAKAAAAETKGAIASVGDQAEKEEKRVSRFGSTIRSALVLGAKAGAAGVVALGGAVAFAGFKFDDLKQRANIAFTTMLGSGQKAQAFLAQLQKFAASTPFEFPQLIQTSQRLLAMGFNAKQVVPTLTAIGDAVAGLGGSPETMDRITTALGQIQAKGKVASEEMLQLTESGIPAWQLLADKIGVSVPKAMELVQARAVDSNLAIAALTEGMEKRFGGMMEKQAHTFSGLLSTVKDTFTQLAGTVMAPFFSMATKGLQRIVDVTSGPGFTAGIQRFGDVLSKQVGPVVRQVAGYIVQGFQAIAPIVREVATAVFHAWQAIGPPILTLFKALVRAIWPIVQGLASIIRSTFEALARTLNAHRAEIDRIVERISQALAGISKVLQVVVLPIIRFVFTQVLPRAIGYAITAIDKLTGIIAGIVKFFVRAAKGAGEAMGSFFNWLVKTAIGVALQVVEPFSHLPGKLGGWARDAKDALHAQLEAMHSDAAKYGGQTGDAWGKAYFTAANGWLTAAGQNAAAGFAANATAGGGAGGGVKGGLSSGGIRFGVVTTAASQLGIPYQWGGPAILGHSTDCSGLVQAVFRKNGINLPRTTYDQWRAGKPVSVAELQPGDLVFFHMGPRGPEHVGIYVGGDRFLEDPHTGAAVRYSKLSTYPSYVGARRVIPDRAGATAGKPGDGKPKGEAAPKPTTTSFAPPTDDLYGVTDSQVAGTLTSGSSKAAASSAKTRAKAVTAIRDQVAELAQEYAKLPPAAQKIVAPKMAELRDELAHVTDDRTLAKARRGLSELKAAINGELSLQKSVQIVRDQATTLADAIGRLPAAARADLVPKMAELRGELARVTTQRDLSRVKADLKKIQDAVKASIDAMIEDVKQRRDAFGRAFGIVADKALEIFDAKTDALLKAARISFEGLSLGEGDLTLEERALQDFQTARELDQRAKARAKDVAARDALLVESAEETAEERTKRLEDLADAEDKLRQDDLDEQERALQKAADLSRRAADDALDVERDRIQDERNLLRERLAGRLDEIKTAFGNEKLTAEQAQSELLGLLSDPQYQTDFNAAGALIGRSFAIGFGDALGELQATINALANAINTLALATGKPAVIPPINVRGTQNAASAYFLLNPIRRAGGGKIPGRYVGLEDTVLTRLSPGENVIDRRLNAALERELLGPARGRGALAGASIYVLGTTEREVAAALKRIVDGAPETPGYSSIQ